MLELNKTEMVVFSKTKKIFVLFFACIFSLPIALSFLGKVQNGLVYFGAYQSSITCSFLSTFGIPCATCGLTRGWICLAHGDFVQASNYNVYSVSTFFAVLIISIYFWCLLIFSTKIRLNNFVLFLVPASIFISTWFPIINQNIKLYSLVGVL